MTLWQFGCAVAGYAEAHGGGDDPAPTFPSDDDFEQALMRLN